MTIPKPFPLFEFLVASLLFCAIASPLANAQARAPRVAPPTPEIAPPRDLPYPGTLKLMVDATDLSRRIFEVRETIPVASPGRMTLLFPKWIPGGHSPRGAIDQLGGLRITASGQSVPWTRDVVDMTAFHLDVPPGATALDLSFQFLSAVETKVGRIVMTPEMLNLQWLSMAFYPAGHYASRILIEPSVRLPAGWGFGTALESISTNGGITTFKTTTFENLMDSPMFAGRYFKQLELDPGAKAPVRLNLVADYPEALELKPEHLQAHRNLVTQAYKLFGSRHYDHYDFLVALSEHLGGIGLEHHQSSENRVTPKYFTDWDKSYVGRDLLPHEYAHSWNGKFRRGADSWTPNYNVPMRDSLLWVYEGQTQYWGYVLAARSGLMTLKQTLEAIATAAAAFDNRKGRLWRNVLDTTNDPIIANRRPLSWLSYQRSEDYYFEGQLIWLDADTLIRELTKGKKSLDDFAKAFFGIEDGSSVPVTYDFDDVVKTLNAVTPHDWSAFLKARVEALSERAPLDGLKRGGYQLVYTDTPTDYFKAYETRLKVTHLGYSLGFTIGAGGLLSEVAWDGPAFKAGLTQGVTLVAVNSESYDADKLKDAIKAAAKPGAVAIELLIKDGDRYRTVKIDYHNGLRYPRLERVAGTSARLDEILTARK